MGLDAYIYRKVKHDEPASLTAEAWHDIFSNAGDHLKDLFKRMSAYADKWNYSFCGVLTTAMQEFLDRNESTDGDEIVYFRKFHFLNDFFNYTDENYAKDMLVTKEQCIELLDRAKACLDECNDVPVTLAFNDYNKYGYEDARNDVCNKHFPSGWDDSYYEKVRDLYKAMTNIINNTDWDNEYIVYNADW